VIDGEGVAADEWDGYKWVRGFEVFEGCGIKIVVGTGLITC